MTLLSLLAISLGASVGSILRWVLALRLNPLVPFVPVGTLAANLAGGFVIGVALGYFASVPDLRAEWKLLVITGFCGGLTTFSTFSAEVVTLLQGDRFGWAMGTIALHVVGSLAMTFAGLVSFRWMQGG